MSIISHEQLIKEVKERKIKSVTVFGQPYRLFYSDDHQTLCYFAKGKSRRGYAFSMGHFDKITAVNYVKQVDPDKETYKLVAKFRKEAHKASFTNEFITKCKALPSTEVQWIAEGKKGLYGYGITCGTAIDGQLVSIKAVAKMIGGDFQQATYENRFRQAIKDQTRYSSGTFDFNGYDGSISFEHNEVAGWRGFLSKEYKGTGNGYYYILINDDYFVGHDID